MSLSISILKVLHLLPELGPFLRGWLYPGTGGAITFTEAAVEEAAPRSEPAVPVHGKELAHHRVVLGAPVGMAGEAVASCDDVGHVAHISKLSVSVLAKLADGSHSDFLVCFFSETVRTICS